VRQGQCRAVVRERPTCRQPEQLEGPRRAEAWAKVIASRPSMAGYQEKTDRVLPVLRLTRVR
jgi:hypothetical protein